jgi:hypothetical protein
MEKQLQLEHLALPSSRFLLPSSSKTKHPADPEEVSLFLCPRSHMYHCTGLNKQLINKPDSGPASYVVKWKVHLHVI